MRSQSYIQLKILYFQSVINLQQCSMKYSIVPDTFLNITNHSLMGTYTALETVVVYKNKINKLCLESMAFFIRSKIIFINLIGNIY